jgi:Nitrile hydratase, alpha chain
LPTREAQTRHSGVATAIGVAGSRPSRPTTVAAATWRETGSALLVVGDDVELRTVDSTADIRDLVTPRRPRGTDGLSEEHLAARITHDCMIGVAELAAPAAASTRFLGWGRCCS